MRRVLVAVMIAMPTASALAQVAREPTRILIVYGHDPNSPGVVAFSRQLKTVLRAEFSAGLEIYEENLYFDRLTGPDRSLQLARYFTEKYRRFKPDAIVAEGAWSLRFVTERLVGLFPDVPVVYGFAFEPVIDFRSLPANVVGRRLSLSFASTYSLARALHPDAERVVVVAGAAPSDTLLLSKALGDITPLLNGMELSVYRDWTYEQLLDSLRRFPPRTFVLLSGFSRDRQGREFNSGDLVASVTRVASVPMYGAAHHWVGAGIVGGGVLDLAEDGGRVGRILMRVLRRTPSEPMPASEVGTARLVVDWQMLQRWGVSEDRLPPNTEVLFKPLSLWERHRGAVLIVLGLLVVESLLIALLLVERRRRVRAQRAVEETRGQVEHMGRVATVNGLAAAVSHDLRQPLGAIRMNAEAGNLLLARTPPDVEETRLALQQIIRDEARAAAVIEHFRTLLRKQDPIITTVDLNALCRNTAKLVEHEAKGRSAQLLLQLDPDIPPVRGDPVQLQQALINLTLNALDAMSASPSNREAAIRTTANNGDVEVHVSDTGPGLSPETQQHLFEPFFSTKPHGLGMGLTIVRSIAERHDGNLRAENRSVGGAVFTVTLPAGQPTSPNDALASP